VHRVFTTDDEEEELRTANAEYLGCDRRPQLLRVILVKRGHCKVKYTITVAYRHR
jgi:hypothetical protein